MPSGRRELLPRGTAALRHILLSDRRSCLLDVLDVLVFLSRLHFICNSLLLCSSLAGGRLRIEAERVGTRVEVCCICVARPFRPRVQVGRTRPQHRLCRHAVRRGPARPPARPPTGIHVRPEKDSRLPRPNCSAKKPVFQ